MVILRALVLCAGLLVGTAWCGDLEVSFNQPAKLGATTLNPGRYKVKLQGSVVIFTDDKSKSTTAVANIEKTEKRADATSVLATTVDGVAQVKQIVLAGADFKLRFGN
jgi:hypothetical protein